MSWCRQCGDDAVARGLCNKHYQRDRRDRLGPEYEAWDNIVQRCTNDNHPRYHRYGGRGIGIDPSFLGPEGYANFLEEVGRRPADPAGWDGRRAYYSIDRIDNDGGYEPGNLRWATPSEQALNREPGYQLRLAA